MRFMGCILPHGTEIISELAGQESERFSSARKAVERAAKEILSFSPETIVIATPHNVRLEGHIGIATSEWLGGSVEENGHEVGVRFLNDREFASKLIRVCHRDLIPAMGMGYGTKSGPLSELPLDWGAIVPLWFLRGLRDQAKAVLLSPTRDIPWEQLLHLGRLVGEVSESLGKKTLFIASSDQGHAHHPNGPYGYSPQSALYDEMICAMIREGSLDRLIHLSPQLVEEAKPDSLWQMLILAGFIEVAHLKGELFSYQVPTYYGLITAIYR